MCKLDGGIAYRGSDAGLARDFSVELNVGFVELVFLEVEAFLKDYGDCAWSTPCHPEVNHLK